MQKRQQARAIDDSEYQKLHKEIRKTYRQAEGERINKMFAEIH